MSGWGIMISFLKEKIEWHRMKMVAFDHPYFDIKKHALSERAAEQLLREHRVLDVKEVLRRARIECGIPQPTGAEGNHDPYIDWLQQTHQPIFLFRRFAIVVIAALLLAGFLTLTKPGIALAQELYEVIVSVVDGTLRAQNRGIPEEVDPIDFSKLPAEFSSMEEIAQLTGRVIFVPAEGDGMLIGFSTTLMNSEMMAISSNYIREDGTSYRIAQTIYNSDTYWADASSSVTDEMMILSLPVGITVYLSQMEDGTVYAAAFDVGYDLNIASTDLTLEELQELVKGIQLIG